MGFGFGAIGLKGENCPVPAADGLLPGTYKPSTHDAFCNCMYSSNAMLLARCKWKWMESLKGVSGDPLNGKTLFDPSLPWNVTGMRSRGLTGDLFEQGLLALGTAAEKGVTDLVSQQPATTANIPGTQPAAPVDTRFAPVTTRNTAVLDRLVPVPDQIRLIGGNIYDAGMNVAKSDTTKVVLGVAAVGALAYFFMKRRKGRTGALSGYSPRRRRARR